MKKTAEIVLQENSPRRIGVVRGDVRDKTIKVSISYLEKHPKYGKYIRKRTVLHVHDQDNVSKNGDRVEIAETRPISKTKSWILTRVLEASS